jgi:GNAT superfamily N-acetyltransferase
VASTLEGLSAVLPDRYPAIHHSRELGPFPAIAVSGERALGLVHSVYHPSTWTTNEYCYLQDLFVAEDGRGGGVGRKLIEHVYAEARGRAASRVYWLTHETNLTARRLYDRIAESTGFIQYRRQVS